jgi:hypothetical protein
MITPPGDSSHSLLYTPLNQLSSYDPPAPSSPPTGSWSTGFSFTDDRKPFLTTTPDALSTTRTYDSVTGRLATVVTQVPGATASSNTASYAYFVTGDSAPGELKSVTGPYGVNLGFDYFAKLKKSETWSGLVSGQVAWTYGNDFAKLTETLTGAPVGSTQIAFGYDADKLLTCSQLTSGTCTPTAANALSISRDSQNGLVKTIVLGSITESYGYNSFGELRSKTGTFGPRRLRNSPTTARPNRVTRSGVSRSERNH